MNGFISRKTTDLRDLGAHLWRNGRGWILLTVGGGWFLVFGTRIAYPVIVPYLQTAFDLNLRTVGLLLTLLWVAFAIGQFPAGIVTDRIGEGTALTASLGASAVVLSLLSVSRSVWMLFAATALFGLTTALYAPARYTILTEIYPERSGTAIGLTLAAGNAGNTLIPLAAGLLAGAFAWYVGFGLLVPLFVLMTIGTWLIVPRRTSRSASAVDTLSIGSLLVVARELARRDLIVVTTITVLGMSIWQGFTGFYPTYLINEKGVSSTFASVTFGLFFAMGLIVQPLAGNTGDRLGIKRSFPAFMAIVTASLVALVLVDSKGTILLLTIGLSGILATIPLTMTYLANAIPGDIQNTGLGFIRTTYLVIASSCPLIIGVMADAGFFDEAFLFMAGMAALAAIICAVVPYRRRS